MVVALDGVVECVDADVQHAVVRVFIKVYDLIYKTWLIMGCEVFRSYEMALVEVPLSHACKVYPHKEYDCNCHNAHSSKAYG